jgi:DNA-binding beta-propeller fold protein YncE
MLRARCFRLFLTLGLVAGCLLAGAAAAQPSFVTFESGQVRPLAMSPDGTKLFAVNTPDNQLEVFSIGGGVLTHTASVPVGMEPVAVAARTNTEVWVVNHLSDSVSIVDIAATPARVTRTLLVGDEPRDIVFAGTTGDRAFVTTAHRGQHRMDPSIAGDPGDPGNNGVPGGGDPQLTAEGIGRADVWVFDAGTLGDTIGGTPVEILSFFADTPRALAVSADGNTVYVAAFHSGNQTTAINETMVPDGFDSAGPSGGAPGGVPGPDNNAGLDPAPETGLIVKFDGATWRDADNRDWSALVNFDLPDHDVFSIDANTLASASVAAFDHVGTILFNMVVHPDPLNGKIFVTNTELPNHVRFEGPGDHGGSTVQGHLSESRITVIDPGTGAVDPKHLNLHIEYDKLHTDAPDIVDPTQIDHSLATPLQPVISSDGSKIYMAAYGSAKVGVFDTADIEDPSFATNFDPTVESANYISTGGGPSGLVLDESNGRLYVLTRFANQLEVIDTATKATLETHPLHNPEPPEVVDGRPFLYDAVATSGNGEASCSSCHIFADFDSLAWNLGDPDGLESINNQPSGTVLPPATSFHPMKGPMTTQTLRGMATHGGMHWRGDRVDGFFDTDPCTEPIGAPCNEDLSFRNFIVAFEGLVGRDGPISAPDMQEFADFTLQIMLPPNPVRALDHSLTAAEQAGETLFNGPATDTVANCDGCHRLDPAQGFFGSGGEQSFEGEPQNFKVAHMRNLYQKVGMFGQSTGGPHTGDQVRGFGMLHDGSVDTLKNFLEAPLFSINNAEELDLEQFSLAFPTDLAPIVGQQVTRSSSNKDAVDPRIDLMIARAATDYDSLMLGGEVPECDLVVKGSVGGQARGWVRESGGLFRNDVNVLEAEATVRGYALSEGPLTYTCAPPGSGTRMGINRDEDSFLDGLDNCPGIANPLQQNFDGDALGDDCDPDDDNDGLLDVVETDTDLFVDANDTGTDPFDADSDDDGLEDGREVNAGSNPNDPLSVPEVPSMPAWGLAAFVALLLTTPMLARRRSRVRF